MSTVSVSYEEAPFGRLHWKVLLGGVFGQYSDGFMLGSIGIALSLATTELGLTSWTLGLIGAASLFGLMFGSLFAGPIVDRFGRQAIYQYTMLIFAAVSILQYFVSSAGQLLALRLLLGLAIGADYAVGVTLVSEWTPLKQRARALGFMQAIWAAGYVSAYITGYFLQEAGWRWILLSCAVPSFISLFVRYGTPESPIWLMGKNREADAQQVIRTHLGEGYCIPPLPQQTTQLGWQDLFSPRWRTRSLVSGSFYAFQVIPYFSLSIFLPIIFKNFNMEDPYTSGIVFNVFLFAGVMFGTWIVDKVSRRGFLISTFYLCALALLAIIFVPTSSAMAITLLISVFSFTIAAASVLEYAYPPELFPTEIRGCGIGFTIACSRVGAAGATFLLPIVLDAWGTTAALAGCIAALVAGGLICQLFAPETNKKFLTPQA